MNMRFPFSILVVISFAAFSCKSGQKALVGNQANIKTNATIAGSWELTFITGPRIAFDGLYPDKKPTIKFDLENRQVSGNNSCNSYGGTFIVDGQKISFEQMRSTLMACSGNGEATFMKMLQEVDRFDVTEEELIFSRNGIPIMKFKKSN